MKNITKLFEQIYEPKKILVVYEDNKQENNYLIESFDVDGAGCPINAHPLSLQEAADLATCLNSANELNNSFLKPEGLLPKNVLYINPDSLGHVIWYSTPRVENLFFIDDLDIPCGKAAIPGLIWKATKTHLSLFAYQGATKPTINTPLCYAPFFNIYESGAVCMGTVNIQIPTGCQLEEFMQLWEKYFFGSYFSHLINDTSPVKDNIIQLWQSLLKTGKAFPNSVLLKTNKTLKNILDETENSFH